MKFKLPFLAKRKANTVFQSGMYPLPVAQYLRLREQIPALYGLISVNAAILAVTHRNLAPSSLTLSMPTVLIAITVFRMISWVRPLHAKDLNVQIIAGKLRRAVLLAFILSVAFVSWAIAIDQYGGPYEHGQVAIFVAITVLGCIFCLTYLPKAAFIVCATVIGTFFIYCVLKRTEVLIAVAVNIGLVSAVILKLVYNTYKSFVDLELTQRDLRRERLQAQTLGAENALLAQTDALTGLPNRRYFFGKLEELTAGTGEKSRFCVGLIDLDRFKPVNDTHGHAQGDRLLTIIGKRLMSQCPDNVIAARLGGDEFGLIIKADPAEAEAIAHKMCAAIRVPMRLGDLVVSVGSSAGLAGYPEAADSAHALYDRADFALYHAKNQSRGNSVRFSDELENMIRSEQAIDAALQRADLNTELQLAFQPIFYTDTLQPIGVECLARWTSPGFGPICPEQLINAAERAGRARDITLVLFEKALAALQQIPQDLRISFNLSAIDLCDSSTIDAILVRIAETASAPTRIVFEITETSLIAELETAEKSIKRLRSVGARIALDDFGTGYSSLSSLHELPLDMVKIDRSFACRLDDPSGRRLMAAIRNLARALSLDCVIEGIETESQLIGARMGGFTLAQGYYNSRPVTLSELLDLLRNSAPYILPAPVNAA